MELVISDNKVIVRGVLKSLWFFGTVSDRQNRAQIML